MLVLSRKNDESVVIGGSDQFEPVLKVTVLEISDGRVRLGFEVDKDVPVHREEVWERIRASGQRGPPNGGPDRRGSPNADGEECVLSGGRQGKSEK